MSRTFPMMVTLNDDNSSSYTPEPDRRIIPTDTMKTDPVTIHLYGHGLETVGSIDNEPMVTGTFAEDVVTGADGVKYAVFTVSDTFPAAPSIWAGTYRINVDRLAAMGEDVFSTSE